MDKIQGIWNFIDLQQTVEAFSIVDNMKEIVNETQKKARHKFFRTSNEIKKAYRKLQRGGKEFCASDWSRQNIDDIIIG